MPKSRVQHEWFRVWGWWACQWRLMDPTDSHSSPAAAKSLEMPRLVPSPSQASASQAKSLGQRVRAAQRLSLTCCANTSKFQFICRSRPQHSCRNMTFADCVGVGWWQVRGITCSGLGASTPLYASSSCDLLLSDCGCFQVAYFVFACVWSDGLQGTGFGKIVCNATSWRDLNGDVRQIVCCW